MVAAASVERFARARRVLEDYSARLAAGGAGRRPRRAATGIDPLDAALGGGLPMGAICEIVADRAGLGALSLALRLAWAAVGAGGGCGRTLFVVEVGGGFYPPGAEQLGLSLDRLIVVRAGRAAEAVWAAEQILLCREAGVVVARWAAPDERAARRLQLAAEAGGTIGLLVHGEARSAAGRFAAARMTMAAEPGQMSAGSPVDRLAQRLRLVVQRRGRGEGATIGVELVRRAGRSEIALTAAFDEARLMPNRMGVG